MAISQDCGKSALHVFAPRLMQELVRRCGVRALRNFVLDDFPVSTATACFVTRQSVLRRWGTAGGWSCYAVNTCVGLRLRGSETAAAARGQPLNQEPRDCPKRVQPCTDTACLLVAAPACVAGQPVTSACRIRPVLRIANRVAKNRDPPSQLRQLSNACLHVARTEFSC